MSYVLVRTPNLNNKPNRSLFGDLESRNLLFPFPWDDHFALLVLVTADLEDGPNSIREVVVNEKYPDT